jgi:hypothetical protein
MSRIRSATTLDDTQWDCWQEIAGNRRYVEDGMLQVKSGKRTEGQSLTELALVLPLLVLILALSADFGRAFTAYISISSAAREGAAYGMQSTLAAQDTSGMTAAVLAESPSIWGVTPDVSFPPCTDGNSRPDGSPYECVAVRVIYEFQPILSIGPIPDVIPMQRTVEMRVVN